MVFMRVFIVKFLREENRLGFLMEDNEQNMIWFMYRIVATSVVLLEFYVDSYLLSVGTSSGDLVVMVIYLN